MKLSEQKAVSWRPSLGLHLRTVVLKLSYSTRSYILIATAPASQVTVVGKVVTRDGLCQNERILIHAINHIGSRVGVDVVYLHLTALYEFMGVPIDRTKAAKSDYRFQAGMSQIQKIDAQKMVCIHFETSPLSMSKVFQT